MSRWGNTGARYTDRGKKDQPHNVAKAKSFLATAAHLRNTTSTGVASIFNLSDRQAEVLLLAETARREREAANG